MYKMPVPVAAIADTYKELVAEVKDCGTVNTAV
jgi:hypothetical protein